MAGEKLIQQALKYVKNLKGEKVQPPTMFYRGTNPGSTERIRTGMPDWDSYLFAADNPNAASYYGSEIEKIQAKPDAKILYEGTKDWKNIAGQWKKDENLLQYANRAANAAKEAGYDAAWFQRQGDVGTSIFNPDAFIRNYSDVPHEADGGEVEAALHFLRQHRAEGGFLSGPDYLSTGEAASPTNWGDPELASDFFKADRAARLAREVLAQEPARDIPLPPRRPPPVSEEAVAAAPLLARASLRVKEEEPAVPSVDEKFTARATSGPELTERDRDLIIRTIAAETSGKSPEESQAIAHVILNRIQSGKFGASPEAVLFAKNQFEPWSNPKGANYPMRFTPTSARYGMGRTALEAALGGDDITRGALNFWGPKAQSALGRKPPKWAGEMPDYTDIGETRFHRPRAEGGEVEGYAGGGDVVKRALEALRGGKKVFPKPERMFPEGARPAGGEYVDAATGEFLTGQKPARAVIGVTPEGKPVFMTDVEQAEITGSPGPGSTKTKANLFKQKAGWKWNEAPEGYENVPTIVSVENRGQHYYGLGADFPKGVDLERYADAPSEPRLRPTTQGNVYPGAQVGSIDVRGREHPVYDMLTIRNLLAGTGAGAAGSAAVSDNAEAEGYAGGGEVEDALAAVRRHYATDGYVSSTQRLRDVIASIDPEASRDQPVMDPEKMGEAWDRARRNYQNFPVQEGEAIARPLDLSARDVIGGAIAGEARAPGADFRRGVADLLVGSKGLPDSGTLGFGVADAPMLTGIPLTLADMAHDVGQGDYGTAAASAALPAALYARGPLGAAGRRAVEIAKEYAKPAAATAAGVAGATVAPDEAEAAKLTKLLRVVSPEDRLMMVHNLRSHRLADVEKLGGLPVPSTAVIKPEIGFDKFGDITMVAPKEMAHPSRTNPIFAADVYSPRFPSLNDEGTKIFRGFSPSGTRLYSPLTLENAVKEMKGNIRGGEGFSYGVGNVRAGAAPEFKSLEEIQNARDLIVPTEKVSKENAAKRFSELSEKFYPYYGYGGDAWTHEKDFADMMRLAGMGQWGELRKSYKSNIPPELHEEAKAFLDHLKTMPTEYFEGKPQRAVRLNEFRGAVVPGDIAGEQADILRRMGVERLEQYDPSSAASRIEALQKFEGEQFRYGGSIEDRALEISRKG